MKIRRFASLFLVIIVLVGAYAPVAHAAGTPFSDVPQNAWFAEAVAWAYARGITTGSSPTTFSPDNNVTRSEFVTFLYRVHGEPSVSSVARFDDVVNPNRFYFNAVQWAVANGITTGFGGTNEFRPNNLITREDIATMLFRFARLRGDDLKAPLVDLYRFPDRNNVSGYAVESMSWATNRGIVRGNAGRLVPKSSATRAEALTMLYRHIEEVPFTLPPAAGFNHGSIFNGVHIGPAAPRTDNDRLIWDFFRDKGLSPQATAGMMGNLYAESAMRSDIVERAHRSRIIQDNGWDGSITNLQLDERYTNAVNDDTYYSSRVPPGSDARSSFSNDSVGYGLSQWTWHSRKRNMYDFIMERNETFDISCLDSQLDFLWHELNTDHLSVLQDLRTATCVFDASNIVLRHFMNPSNQGLQVQGTRAGFALGYFNRFSG